MSNTVYDKRIRELVQKYDAAGLKDFEYYEDREQYDVFQWFGKERINHFIYLELIEKLGNLREKSSE